LRCNKFEAINLQEKMMIDVSGRASLAKKAQPNIGDEMRVVAMSEDDAMSWTSQ
jgi:hypothetical protein